jgi:Heterokaryon incompatibility protein (HET)
MAQYQYQPLSAGGIRLLELLPRDQDPTHLRCRLFEHHLRHPDNPFHLYEAVSYVWGSEDTPRSIIIDNQSLNITENLYVVLLRLQYQSFSRIIWVDAVCIHQEDHLEKQHQIPLMVEIFAKASRVLVWLGKAENDSDLAIEAIRLAGVNPVKVLDKETFQQAVLRIMERKWFQRIWVREQRSNGSKNELIAY